MSVNPEWERWHKSLRHDEVKSIGDAVEQLMYEVIEFGGDMGPNGNTYNGIDEGDVLTAGYINEWIERFENMLRPVTCHDEGDPSDFCCSECGVRMFTNTSDTYTMIAADERTIIKHPNYCPNCGRKVVE